MCLKSNPMYQGKHIQLLNGCACRHMEKKFNFVVHSAHSVYLERCSFSSH